MKKRIYSIALCAFSALILAAANAQAQYYPDTYIGDTTLSQPWMHNDPNNLDYFGTGYDVAGIDVEVKGGQLVVTLSGDYFNTWATASSVAPSPGGVWAPGSLFLSTNGWNPNGTAPSYETNGIGNTNGTLNGTIWNYAITLNGADQLGATSGTASLYSVVAANIVAGTARVNQEALYDPANGETVLSTGSWALVAGDPNDPTQSLYMLTITMDLPADILADLEKLGYHWSQVCANDVVEGEHPLGSNPPVPEPTTMLLFGVGLIGLVGATRRRGN